MTLRRGQRPDPKDDAAHLSDDDVQRRLGGDAGLGGPVPERAAPPPPIVPVSPATTGGSGGGRRGGVLWRDVGLVLVLLAFLAVGARVVLPDSSAAVASPSPGGSVVAVASPTASPSRTQASTASPTAQVLPSENIPSVPPEATPTASATATPTPATTPRTTPPPTARPTPTATPQTANLTISFLMKNVTGGNDTPASWTVHVTGAGASPSTFTGTSGNTVKVNAGQAYSVTTTPKTPGGYDQELSADCSGTLSANETAQCTITETDIAPKLRVFISGLPDASATTVTISGPDVNASPSSFSGSEAGTPVTLYSNAGYTISTSAVADYAQTSTYGSCSGPLREGASVQCILYFTSTGAAAPGGTEIAAAVEPTTAAILRRR